MLSLKIFLKILPYIWPFIREMVLGKKPILKAIRDNKKKLIFISLVVFSFGLNFFTVPRLVTMSMQYIALDKRFKELEKKHSDLLSTPKHPKAIGTEQRIIVKEPEFTKQIKPKTITEKTERKKPRTTNQLSSGDIIKIREDFAKLKKQEEADAKLNY